MTRKERIFHAILFEAILLALSVAGAMLLQLGEAHALAGWFFVISLVAMLWNYVYNLLCDRLFPAPREQRNAYFRLWHSILFEVGLMVLTIPILAYALNLTWWQAFWADIGLTLLIVVYTFCFNWLYDHIRAQYFANSP